MERSDYSGNVPIQTGDVITVIRTGPIISFKKNDVDLGPAFVDVPEDSDASALFPFVDFKRKGQCISSVMECFTLDEASEEYDV